MIVHNIQSTSVDAAVSKINFFLQSKQVPVFAEIDHKKNAGTVQLDMPEAKVILFGNPALGTHVMKSNIHAAFELPMRVAVVEHDGHIDLIVPDIEELFKEFNFSNEELIAKAKSLIDALIKTVSE